MRRKGINARSIEVDIEFARGCSSKDDLEDAVAAGTLIALPARKRIRIRGQLSQRERTMLINAAKYCPAGQYFLGTGLEITTTFVVVSPDGRVQEQELPRPPRREALGGVPDDFQRDGWVSCRHVREYQSQVIMDTPGTNKGDGPWMFVVDEPPPEGLGAAPPPTYTIMAALVASTISQIAGLVRRNNLAIHRIQVEAAHTRPYGPDAWTKLEREDGWARGRRFTVPASKRVTVHGELAGADRALLQTAALYCPVSQMFMGLDLEETVVFED